ncbi:MAG: hypothetical protein EBV92_12915 [Betaproteobacteria bacterium]|nr:hypothetical protein [Betaproteobacteria bacterium]
MDNGSNHAFDHGEPEYDNDVQRIVHLERMYCNGRCNHYGNSNTNRNGIQCQHMFWGYNTANGDTEFTERHLCMDTNE